MEKSLQRDRDDVVNPQMYHTVGKLGPNGQEARLAVIELDVKSLHSRPVDHRMVRPEPTCLQSLQADRNATWKLFHECWTDCKTVTYGQTDRKKLN